MIGTELETLTQILVLCNIAAEQSQLAPSMAFNCSKVQTYILDNYFDGNYQRYSEYASTKIAELMDELRIMRGMK